MTRRIAMWSGPRNISTALMRSWENRNDCAVTDEPFYAFYLANTGLEHPGRNAILQSQSQDWEEIITQLRGVPPDGADVWYQKHMAHHLLDEIDREWMLDLDHCFLIRDPAAVVSSYLRTRDELNLSDIGVVQQHRIFHWLTNKNTDRPLIVDSADLLKRPEAMLRTICDELGLPFQNGMLSWPMGPRPSDGIWAPYWYDKVIQSTGFLPYRPPKIDIDPRYEAIVDEAKAYYADLYEYRIRL